MAKGSILSDDEMFGAQPTQSAPKVMSDDEMFGGGKDISKLKSAGLGAAQAATLGYAPQLFGMLASVPPEGSPGMDNIDPAEMSDQYIKARDYASEGINKAKEANPKSFFGGQLGGALISAPLLPGGAAAKEASVLGNMGKTALVGSGAGLIANPGDTPGEYSGSQMNDRLGNAAVGGVAGGLISGGLSAAKSAGGLLTKLGSKVGKITPEAGEAYAAAPKEAEALFEQSRKNPIEFQRGASKDLENGLQSIRKNVIAPKSEELNKTMIGKTFKISTDQFNGTAVEKELQDAWNKQGVMLKIPVSDAERYMTGQAFKEVPAPMPRTMTVSGPQLLRAKRAAFEASEFNEPKNGLGYSAAESAQAKLESSAGNSLRTAMEKASPKMAKLNDELEEAFRISRNAEKTGNPTQLLNPSDSLGGLPNRAIRQYIQQAGGSDLEKKARLLEAASSLNRTQNSVDPGSLINTLLSQPAAKGLLKTGGLLNKVTSKIPNTSPAVTGGVIPRINQGR